MATSIIYQKLFNPQILPVVPAVLYQVPSAPISTELRGGRLRVVNLDTAAHTFTAYAVPSGIGSAIPATAFGYNVSVAAGSFFDIDVPILAISDAIWMSASVSGLMVVHLLNGFLIQ